MAYEVLGIAAQAIAAQQLALDVTGNNMANATTPGYHVESVDLTENAPAPDAAMLSTLIGNGVTATAVTRATNGFLSSSVRNQTSAVNYATALAQGLNGVQNIFSEPQSGGLAEMMNQFNQSWLTLSESPESTAARESVLQDAKTLASTFNSMANTLSSEESSVNLNIQSQITSINQLAGQISHLNKQIATVSTTGQQPNDLLDQRSELLNQLSKLTNISYSPGPANSLDVYIGDHPLVTGTQTYTMTYTPVSVTNASGVSTFSADVPMWADTNTRVQAQSGSLAGNMALLYSPGTKPSGNASPGYLTTYGDKLDNLAQSVMATVNKGQANGSSLTGSAGTALFTGTSAATIEVVSTFSANDLAAATYSTTPNAGDGSNASAIYNALSNSSMTIGSSQQVTLSGYYQSLVGEVGLDGQNATQLSSDGQQTLTSLNNELQSVTGVDVNQQSVNMIEEQQSYEAAAKLITTQQTMTQSLLSAVS